MPGMKMQPDSKATRMLELLRESPAKTSEIAAELDWPVEIVSAHLCNLRKRGKVTSHNFAYQPFGRPGHIWRIVEVQP